jgi:hypothetical protein
LYFPKMTHFFHRLQHFSQTELSSIFVFLDVITVLINKYTVFEYFVQKLQTKKYSNFISQWTLMQFQKIFHQNFPNKILFDHISLKNVASHFSKIKNLSKLTWK